VDKLAEIPPEVLHRLGAPEATPIPAVLPEQIRVRAQSRQGVIAARPDSFKILAPNQ